MLDLDIKAWCESIRGMKPPFECPFNDCRRIYKSFAGIEQHVYTHNPESAYEDALSPTSPTRKSFDFAAYSGAQKVLDIEINGEVHQLNVENNLRVVTSEEFNSENSAKFGKLAGSNKRKKGKCVSELPATVSSNANVINTENAKLPLPSFRYVDCLHAKASQPIKKFLGSEYIRYTDKSFEDLERDTEYDMDEEDSSWLQLVNKQRKQNNLAEVSEHMFEKLVDRLEKEAFFQSQTGETSASAQYEDNATCSICQDGECQNTNVILFCDMCNIAVHQECYGVPYIPEGQWMCRRCLHSPSRAVECCLCPNGGGAFKQTDDGQWAHVVCALWVPEVGFSNIVFLEPIDGINRIPPARWKLTCYICKQRGKGACIQCHKPNCYVSFHVTCAQLAGLYMKIEAMRGIGFSTAPVQVRKTAFCDQHSPFSGGSMIDNGDDVPKKLSSSENLEKSRMKIRMARKLLAERRNVPPVISVPVIKQDRLDRIASSLSIPKKAEFVKLLAAYWMLKRQSRNGVPLLRRLQSYNQNREKVVAHSDEELNELRERHKDIRRVRQEMEKVRLLLELIRKREKLKRELSLAHIAEIEVKVFPLQMQLHRLLDNLIAADDKSVFTKSAVMVKKINSTKCLEFSDLKERVESNNYYHSIDSFLLDLQTMFKTTRQRHNRNSILALATDTLQDLAMKQVEEIKSSLETEEAVLSTNKNVKNVVEKLATENGPDVDMLTSKSDTKHVALEGQLAKLIDKLDNLDSQRPNCQMRILNLLRKEIGIIRRKLCTEGKGNHLDVNNVNGIKIQESTTDDDALLTPPQSVEDSTSSQSADFGHNKVKGNKRPTDLPAEENNPAKRRRRRNVNVKSNASHRKLNGCLTNGDTDTDELEQEVTEATKHVNLLDESSNNHCRRHSIVDKTDDLSVPSPSGEHKIRRSSSLFTDEVTALIDGFMEKSQHLWKVRCKQSINNNNQETSEDSNDGPVFAGNEEKVIVDETVMNIKPADLVWAKCAGYAWYPALIVDPKGNNSALKLPQPSAKVLAEQKKYDEPVFLVSFFDERSSWQWLPRKKIVPLGLSGESDRSKLLTSKDHKTRKGVLVAYKRAVKHCLTDNDDKLLLARLNLQEI